MLSPGVRAYLINAFFLIFFKDNLTCLRFTGDAQFFDVGIGDRHELVQELHHPL